MKPDRVAERPLLIGWKEFVAFPEWGVRRVKAKIDTGARTSALDAVGYDLFDDGSGPRARLRLALDRRHPERLTVVEAPVLGMVEVRCTSGATELRPLVEVEMRLGPVRKRIRLTVTNRSAMRFRMILGRLALAEDFVVDVSQKYLLRRRV